MCFENINSMPLSFDGSAAVEYIKNNLFAYFKKIGLDPFITEEWKKGIYELFDIQSVDYQTLDKNCILLSNHISDFDGIILGLLYPKTKIVAKIGWTNNKELMEFMSLHYDIVGIYRDFEIDNLNDKEKIAAKEHNTQVNLECFKHLKNTGEAHHLLIFPQGTISDINKNSKERINGNFARIAIATKTSAMNIFLEYPGTDGITRIVSGVPYNITDRNLDYRQIWLDDMIGLQSKLGKVRTPVLSKKHSQNNNPDEPFF